ncbi:MAG: gluconolactonase [Deltaproteobacteria bacterium]|nr:gluconolactonase [Deltaproteobacteria bacterium]
MHGHRVMRSALDGQAHEVARIEDDHPSGLGWLPDGRLLVVAMATQQLRRVEPDGSVVVHADLSDLAVGNLNDMISAPDGTAWVGDMGFDVHAESAAPGPGQTIVVRPDGTAARAAGDLIAPNGHILTEDARTLIVAESGGFRLTAFDVASDGSLDNRRTYAALTPEPGFDFAPPDGVCLDAEGAVWLGDPIARKFYRVLPGGEVTDCVVPAEGAAAIACTLGGPDRKTLLMACSHELPGPDALEAGNAWIEALRVDVAGAGRP